MASLKSNSLSFTTQEVSGIADFNSIADDGLTFKQFNSYSDSQNKPGDFAGFLIQFRFSSTTAVQIAVNGWSSTTAVYVRHQWNTWSAWRTVNLT